MHDSLGVAEGAGEQREQAAPIVTFYRLVPECRLPMRADRAAAGTMPTRAFRYCEAMTAASAFGWYVFPPITFSLMWDGGSEIFWTYKGQDAWFPLRKVQFPGFAEYFDNIAPEAAKGFSPSFLSAFKEPGVVQIWSGLIARTAPEWSLLVRSPANLARSQGYENYEGIIETDRWFGPLFTNVRLRELMSRRIQRRISFSSSSACSSQTYGAALDRFEVSPNLVSLRRRLGSLSLYRCEAEHDPHRQRGQYAVTARRRGKSPTDVD